MNFESPTKPPNDTIEDASTSAEHIPQHGYQLLLGKLELARKYLDAQEQADSDSLDTSVVLSRTFLSDIPELDPQEDLLDEQGEWKINVQELVPNTWIEKTRAEHTTRVINEGLTDQFEYQAFHYRERVHSGAKKIWLSFPGLQAGQEGEEKDPDKLDAHSMIPPEGVGITFYGPSGIAGLSPDQSMECSDRVLAQVQEILKAYPGYEVNVIGFSAGTHLAHYVANQLGEQAQEQVVQNMITVSSGMGIGMGIFSTEVTKPLHDHLYAQGIDRYLYTAAMKGYNQFENTKWIPQGEHFRTFYSPGDKFIPPELEGGSMDYVRFLEDAGIIHSQEESVRAVRPLGLAGDHVSIVGSLILEQKIGKDPYGLGDLDSTHWMVSDHKDTYLDIVESRMANLDDQEMRSLISTILPNRPPEGSLEMRKSGTRMTHELSDNERAVVEVLQRQGLVNVINSGRNYDYVGLTQEGVDKYYKRSVKEFLKEFRADESNSRLPWAPSLVDEVASVDHIDLGTTYNYPTKKQSN
jgi:pimeloyl-ACP methyl ester carboxylesterase